MRWLGLSPGQPSSEQYQQQVRVTESPKQQDEDADYKNEQNQWRSAVNDSNQLGPASKRRRLRQQELDRLASVKPKEMTQAFSFSDQEAQCRPISSAAATTSSSNGHKICPKQLVSSQQPAREVMPKCRKSRSIRSLLDGREYLLFDDELVQFDDGIYTKTSNDNYHEGPWDEQFNCCPPLIAAASPARPNKHGNRAIDDRDNQLATTMVNNKPCEMKSSWPRAMLARTEREENSNISFNNNNNNKERTSGVCGIKHQARSSKPSSSAVVLARISSKQKPIEAIQDKQWRRHALEDDDGHHEEKKVGRHQGKHSQKQSSWPNGLFGKIVTICLFLMLATATKIVPFAPGPLVCSAQVLKAATSGGNQQTTLATNSASSTSSNNAGSTVGCPYPGVNPNCQVNIIAQAPAVPLLNTEFVADEYSTLKQDTQAAYKCDHGYELLGPEQITCLASGRWSASPPNCVTNIAIGKPTNQSSTVRGGDSRNANDGKLITQHDSKYCTETKVDQSPWWQIDLLQVYEIRSVRILGRACCNPHLSLHDIEIRVGNSSTLQGNRLCAWYPNNLDEGTSRDFQCAHPILGRFVSIQMVGIESALSLCEVMVFSTREFHPDRCGIQSTLAPSLAVTGSNRAGQSAVITTTSATTTQQTNNPTSSAGSQDNQIIVFNRTCYETQAANGGSFLVADTYCKARGGSLLHSVNDLTQSFISQELERMKSKLKSKLVWLGAKRENASPNAQGPITPGSTSALFASDRSLSASLHEFPIESLFSNDHGLISSGETSSIFSPTIKLSRSALLQTSSGAGGATSRGSQTFGLQTTNNHHHHLTTTNGSITHPGRSLIISQPSQVSSFFAPPVPISNSMSPSSSNLSPTLVSPTHSSSSSPSSSQSSSSALSSSPISFSSPNTHVHRTLRPPSLVSTQAPSGASLATSNWNPSRIDTTSSAASPPQPSPTSSTWRWVGDAASETIMSPITNFLWADDQPNNYNNQQDCIVLDGGKKWLWNDVTCELDYLPWVCQYRPSTCGSPDRHENSTILEVSSSSEDGSTEKAYQLGKVITYACPIGHRLDGPRTRKCLYDGSWSGKAPKCQYINCGPIGSQTIENGRVVYLNQSQTTYGSQVKYVCYEDYVLVGDDTRQCQADGRWGGKQPFCAYKWCPVLQQISNGQLNVSSYSENSIATYQCNSGYKLIGNDTRQCLLGGKWTNQEPFCQYVDCGQPKQIPNGSHQLINGTTNYLSVAAYTCNENYTLVGSHNKLICSHNNRWTGRDPQCTLIDCGPPQVNTGSRFSGLSFTVHSSVEYKCDPGFKEVSGSSQRTCGLDGQWTGQPLTCKYVDCGRVPAILKGEVSYINGTTYLASQISYECTPGNRISGHRVRFCGPDGRWTGTSPKCEEVRCDAPELPANGSAIYIGNDRSFKEQSFSVGVTVQYECDYGHVVRGSWSSRLCQANGEWSGEPPVCKFVDCGQPSSIENGNYLLKHPPAGASIGTATPIELARRSDGVASGGSGSVGTFTYYGTIAHYSCDANYKLLGPAQRECLETGQWRTPLPTCEPIQCPKPEYFDEYTQVALIPKGAQMPDMIQPPGDHQSVLAMLATVKTIKLIANSQWINQQAANQSFGVGDKLHYSCVPGYELYGGPELRTCTQYGQWSGSSTPRCRLIDCGRPAPIGQEGRYYLLNETTTFNSLVEYSCVRPFKLVEVKIRQAGNLIETLMNAQAGVTPILTSLPIGVKVCANNGQWMPNDQQPKCTTGGAGSIGQFDGGDNTLDGTNRQVHLSNGVSSGGNSNGAGGHPSFINVNGAGGNQDVDNNNFDASNSSGQTNSSSQSAYFWAKVLLVISLPLMFAIITVTLICIRSKKKPKQVMHRASILTSSGQQAAAAAAAMQIQLASSKGLQHQQHQQQQSLMVQSSHNHNHHHHNHGMAHAPSMLPGQNIYINGMQKMFPGSMVGQSQMSSVAGGGVDRRHQHSNMIPASYGDTMILGAGGQDGGQPAIGRSMAVPLNGPDQMMMMNGTKPSVSLGGVNGGRLRGDHAASASSMDSYSRLSIESEQTNVVGTGGGGQTGLGSKTIRHNPNGLVTFVSPAQQQQQQQQQKNASSGQQQQVSNKSSSSSSSASTSSTSSGVSSSSHQHQISPQSISTSLSVSSSSSPSSSSSAHHTAATRLSAGTDSTSSPTSIGNGANPHHQQIHHQTQAHHITAHDQQQQSEYEAPQQFVQQVSTPVQTIPPSLPAHPPPPHRVQQQQQFKQLMKHQHSTASGGAKQATAAGRVVSSSSSGDTSRQAKQQQQQNLAQNGKNSAGGGGPGDHHYMEPGV